jgi:hypothetical protein
MTDKKISVPSTIKPTELILNEINQYLSAHKYLKNEKAMYTHAPN